MAEKTLNETDVRDYIESHFPVSIARIINSGHPGFIMPAPEGEGLFVVTVSRVSQASVEKLSSGPKQ